MRASRPNAPAAEAGTSAARTKTVLLVIDMIEGFCVAGNPLYVGPQVERTVAFIRRKIEERNQAGERVYFTGCAHRRDDPEFQMFPPHCIKGTREARVVAPLRDVARRGRYFAKTRYSGFHGTRLGPALARLRPDVVEVTGVCTNICVFFTVEELRNRDYTVVVYRQGVTSFDAAAHRFALRQMQNVLGARVV